MVAMTVDTDPRLSKILNVQRFDVQIAMLSSSVFSLVRGACFQRSDCHPVIVVAERITFKLSTIWPGWPNVLSITDHHLS